MIRDVEWVRVDREGRGWGKQNKGAPKRAVKWIR